MSLSQAIIQKRTSLLVATLLASMGCSSQSSDTPTPSQSQTPALETTPTSTGFPTAAPNTSTLAPSTASPTPSLTSLSPSDVPTASPAPSPSAPSTEPPSPSAPGEPTPSTVPTPMIEPAPTAWAPPTPPIDLEAWARSIGGAYDDIALGVAITTDQHLAVAGTTRSTGHGQGDAWVVLSDDAGHVQWSQTFGGPLEDGARAITSVDDGLVVAGFQTPPGGEAPEPWLAKLGPGGHLQWEAALDAQAVGIAMEVAAGPDGGLFAVGGACSPGGEVGSAWMTQLSAAGQPQWYQQASTSACATTVTAGAFGGAYVGALREGDSTWPLTYGAFSQLTRLGADGGERWTVELSDGLRDVDIVSVAATPDGGVTAALNVSGEVSTSELPPITTRFVRLVGFNLEGEERWSIDLRQPGALTAGSIRTAADGGALVSSSWVPEAGAPAQLMVFKLNSRGEVTWSGSVGAEASMTAHIAIPTRDASVILAGQTQAHGHGQGDALLLRTQVGHRLPLPQETDGDADGYLEPYEDCDPTDPLVHEGAAERCDSIDNDCDGMADEGLDNDGDGLACHQDNCIFTYNPDQADGDADGFGDACDRTWAGALIVKEAAEAAAFCDAGYGEITGHLRIEHSALTHLDDLSCLNHVGGLVSIKENPTLTHINGLWQLGSVGDGIYVRANPRLVDLDGFSGLTSVMTNINILSNPALRQAWGFWALEGLPGSLRVEENPSLVTLGDATWLGTLGGSLTLYANASLSSWGAAALPSTVHGDIVLRSNPKLASLHPLREVETIEGDLLIHHNNALTDLSPLEAVISVGNRLDLSFNAHIEGDAAFPDLTTIGGDLVINSNTRLATAFTPRTGLTIGGGIHVEFNPLLTSLALPLDQERIEGELYLGYNPALTHIQGLNQVATVTGAVTLERNDSLPSLQPLSSITTVGEALTLHNNDALSDLEALSDLDLVEGDVTVTDHLKLSDEGAWTWVESIGEDHIGGQVHIGNNGAAGDPTPAGDGAEGMIACGPNAPYDQLDATWQWRNGSTSATDTWTVTVTDYVPFDGQEVWEVHAWGTAYTPGVDYYEQFSSTLGVVCQEDGLHLVYQDYYKTVAAHGVSSTYEVFETYDKQPLWIPHDLRLTTEWTINGVALWGGWSEQMYIDPNLSTVFVWKKTVPRNWDGEDIEVEVFEVTQTWGEPMVWELAPGKGWIRMGDDLMGW